jgi:membrane-associated phospholipid phosphatase
LTRPPSLRPTLPQPFKAWLAGLCLTAALVWISVRWIDRPVALLVHEMFGSKEFPGEMTRSPVLSVPLISALFFVIYGLAAVIGRRFSRIEKAILLCDISLLATDAIKDQLKFVFGRTWPDSWQAGILSLIHDNAYGFHSFKEGKSFESFPSGHAATAGAVLSVLWILFPNLRALCATGIVMVDLGLVLLNLHFVSDVVAGTFVGASAGLFTVSLAASFGHHPSAQSRRYLFREGNEKVAASVEELGLG